ncbi:MAG: primosomal protein N', partial [Lentisphaeria bacterium]|nr:primosomal protein N' [Lentisphaeria bacterium]
ICVEKKEQVMLFLNRRGYATQMQCMQCGFVAECDSCTQKFTYHQKKEMLACHICGDVRKAYTNCPACSDSNIRYGGIGTEKVEASLRGALPGARILRMDSDTMTRKDSYTEALGAFRAGSVDILVGTQMIAKGLHFPNVTLVGVIMADMSLHLPDFRAGERTYQLLVQVAGRAGRGELAGNVIVQTYTPYHPALAAAMQLNYQMLYDEEIPVREMLGFPPYKHLIKIHLHGANEEKVQTLINDLSILIKHSIGNLAQIIDPMPCSIVKRRGEYHYQFLLNTDKVGSCSKVLKHCFNKFRMPARYRVFADVDPTSLL